jgi:hypothetical protein
VWDGFRACCCCVTLLINSGLAVGCHMTDGGRLTHCRQGTSGSGGRSQAALLLMRLGSALFDSRPACHHAGQVGIGRCQILRCMCACMSLLLDHSMWALMPLDALHAAHHAPPVSRPPSFPKSA